MLSQSRVVLTLLSLSACLTATSPVAQTATATVTAAASANSTYYNPILPGFHPDPSCIYLPEKDNGTFFCASSSFNAFPGIPIHASKDLQNWRLIGHVLNRREQLPRLAETNRSTSGIWAPTLRYHDDTFWLITTLVDDDRPQADSSRWDNIIFKGSDPYDDKSWSNAIHFAFEGYDPDLFFHEDGKVYITAAHAWQVGPRIEQATVDLETGKTSQWKTIWEGTGGMAPEGPHIYYKDGYYYMLAAEGGTGVDHMVTMARSKSIDGPFESNPANPVLTNANTTSLFQTIGHADLFQDGNGNWWAVALSTRSGPEYKNFPMGRETIMTPVSWPEGQFPVFSPVNGKMSGWPMPSPSSSTIIKGNGPLISQGDSISTFSPNSSLPAHFTYWRYPNHTTSGFIVSPPENPGTLKLTPSKLNLTALNGNYAGPSGQSFIARRQQDTLFTYSVDLDFSPTKLESEAGVTAFLTQNHHLTMGIVLLPSPHTNELVPHVRFRGESYVPVPRPVVEELPREWWAAGNRSDGEYGIEEFKGLSLTLEIKATNATHYVFSLGPKREGDGKMRQQKPLKVLIEASNEPVSWGFTGVLLGVYCTSNGGNGTTPAYFSNWRYIPQGQARDWTEEAGFVYSE